MQEQELKEFMAGLVETNKKIWDEWTKALQSNQFGGGEQVEKIYRQNLEAVAKVIRQTLDAESQWLDQWYQSLSSTQNAPEPMLQLLEGVHRTMKAMLTHRAEMWESLLAQAQGMSLDSLPSFGLGADSQNTLTRIWEEFYQNAIKVQQQLMGGAPATSGEPQPAPKPQAASEPAAAKAAAAKAAPAASAKADAQPAKTKPAAAKKTAAKPKTTARTSTKKDNKS